MKTLHLALKSQWYSMIECGEKKEEYREIKPYWITRLFRHSHGVAICNRSAEIFSMNPSFLSLRLRQSGVVHEDYTHVCFSYGYTKRTMTFEIESITIGVGNPAWGAPAKEVIIIKLGNKIQDL